MKYKHCKDCIRVKMKKSEYQALVHMVALSQEFNLKKSIDDACKCAEMCHYIFIDEVFDK